MKKGTANKERIHSIKFPVYPYTIHVVITDDIIRSRNERVKEIGHLIEDNRYIVGLHSHKEGDNCGFIFLTKGISAGTIAHESYHAVSRMMEYIHAEKEEEIMAYHLTYVVDEITKILK